MYPQQQQRFNFFVSQWLLDGIALIVGVLCARLLHAWYYTNDGLSINWDAAFGLNFALSLVSVIFIIALGLFLRSILYSIYRRSSQIKKSKDITSQIDAIEISKYAVILIGVPYFLLIVVPVLLSNITCEYDVCNPSRPILIHETMTILSWTFKYNVSLLLYVLMIYAVVPLNIALLVRITLPRNDSFKKNVFTWYSLMIIVLLLFFGTFPAAARLMNWYE